jgi:hypothetical protein
MLILFGKPSFENLGEVTTVRLKLKQNQLVGVS